MGTYTKILVIGILIPWIALAHSGGTDGDGCHTCRTNCEVYSLEYEEYHCHNPKEKDADPLPFWLFFTSVPLAGLYIVHKKINKDV